MSKHGYYIRLQYDKAQKAMVHVCKTPGWFDRMFMGATLGAIWHCMECGQEWIYQVDISDPWSGSNKLWLRTAVKQK